MAWPVRPWLIGMTDRQQPFAAPVGNCKNSTEHLHAGSAGNEKVIVLAEDKTISGYRRVDSNPRTPVSPLTVDDVSLRVRLKKDDVVENDCSCDSAYMLGAMKRVGTAVRSKYHWIPRSQKCYIVMDNAGGHGTDEAIEEYRKMLLDDFNIEIIHQVPRSPYTNLLDLGVWCSLQSMVEKVHYQKRTDVGALVSSVNESWNISSGTSGLDSVIGKVWGRLRNVLVLIAEGKGSNDLVEKKRGKTFRNLDMPIEFLQTPLAPEQQSVATNNGTNDQPYDLVQDEEDSDEE